LTGADLDAFADKVKYEGEAKADPTSGSDTKGLPLLYILVVTIALPYLAEALVTVYQRARSSGLVISEGSTGLVIRSDDAIPPDLLIIKDKNGIKLHEIRKPSDPSVLLPILSNVVSKWGFAVGR
jgi:hypothetical protein